MTLCGYGIMQKNGVYKVERVKPIEVSMKDKSTYKKIYDICKQLLDNDLKYLAFLLILQLCEESEKSSEVNKLLKSYGYYEKFKKLIHF